MSTEHRSGGRERGRAEERNTRFVRFAMSVAEAERLDEVYRKYMVYLAAGGALDGAVHRTIAQAISVDLARHAPKLARQLARARAGEIDASYITGLPTDPEIARGVLLVITYAIGYAFNFSTQNGGKLVMELRPDPNSSQANTNTTTDEFRAHTDDAAIAGSCRVGWILLYGIVNPPETVTGYAPIAPVIKRLSHRTKQVLFEKRFTVRVPVSFKLGDDIWTDPVAILSLSDTGATEIAWPSYATKPVDERDQEALDALAELEALVDQTMVHVPVDPGCMLAFSNVRGVHMRSKIGEGDRLILRTYARDSLADLREVTQDDGPIFDTQAVIAARLR
jgi:hypothetical protein